MMKRARELAADLAETVRGRRVVVGLSGGVDSVVLTHLLVRGGADVRAAHVDHGLRAESPQDAAFCADVAANLGILFGQAQIEIERGNSTQGRARVQRYAALVRLATELGGDLLAVAHHVDDAWESSELQLARGAGAVGAAGPTMWSTWHGFDLVRPLLGERRHTIESVAAELGLRWREDPSNLDRSYARARVRAAASFDAAELRARRLAAQQQAEQAAVPAAFGGPTTRGYDRARLAGLGGPVLARVLLDAARELGAELPGAIVEQLVAAIGDEVADPRWFCGRRGAVEVSSTAVVVHASRGQGTRLLQARRTPALELLQPMAVPWFGDEIDVDASMVGLTLRGPRAGDRVDGESLFARLAGSGVHPGERWRWPCLFDDSRCVRVLNKANE